MRSFFFIFCLLLQSGVAATKEYSFDEALKVIKSRHLKIKSQKENIELIKNKNLSSSLSLLPTVSLIGQQSYTKENSSSLTFNKRGLTANASVNLVRFGADVSAMKAASAENEAQETLLKDLELKAEGDAVRTLVALIQASQIRQVTQQILESRKLSSNIAKERYKRGLIALQEADKFLVDFENSQAQFHDAEIDFKRSENELFSFLGEGSVASEWKWKNRFEILLAKLNEFEINKLEYRPELRAQMLKVEAANQRSNQAWGEMMPSLDANLSYGFSENVEPLPKTSGSVWTGTIQISIPLFDRLKNYGEYRALIHQKALVEIEYERLRREARADLDTSKSSYELSYKSALLRERNVVRSRSLYDANLKRFQRAIVNANELLDDQQRLYLSELSSIRGWGDVHLNFTRLCHAIGKSVFECGL